MGEHDLNLLDNKKLFGMALSSFLPNPRELETVTHQDLGEGRHETEG